MVFFKLQQQIFAESEIGELSVMLFRNK